MRPSIRKYRNRLIQRFYTWRHRKIDNFIFIRINKTGSSSIKMALKLPSGHRTALEEIERIGREEWERKFTFTIVRNPWDKVISQYHFRAQTNQTDLGLIKVGFNDWVRLTYGDRNPAYLNKPKMFIPQSDWITDKAGKILVDFVGRFENLNDDFLKICKHIGITTKLPHIKTSKHEHYKDYYSEEAIEIVAAWYKKDLENFGYRF